jgi:hypothetical protein
MEKNCFKLIEDFLEKSTAYINLDWNNKLKIKKTVEQCRYIYSYHL